MKGEKKGAEEGEGEEVIEMADKGKRDLLEERESEKREGKEEKINYEKRTCHVWMIGNNYWFSRW